MTVLLLIRHASNDYIKEGRLAGHTPGVHINAQGQREADELARKLAHLPIEAVYSSPLERAVDTAYAVAACHMLPVQIKAELIEGDPGEWTGRKISDLQGTETWKLIQTKPVGVPLPGGESIDQVQARIVRGIDAICKEHPDGVVAVVSHADPLKAAMAHYLSLDLNHYQRLVISPASVSVLMLDEKGAVLYRLNDAGQLPKFDKPKPARQEQAPAEDKPEGDSVGDPSREKQEQSGKDKRSMAEANIVYDLNPVSRLTIGALGEPGHRTFFLQGRQGATLVTLAGEKEQMTSLGQGISDLLTRLGEPPDAPSTSSPYDLALEEPFEPLFRIGQLGLGYDQESERLVIVAYALAPEEQTEVDVVRFWADRAQMRALSRHVTEVASAGRPICVLCGRPIDPEGHFCPRRNGHGAQAQLA